MRYLNESHQGSKSGRILETVAFGDQFDPLSYLMFPTEESFQSFQLFFVCWISGFRLHPIHPKLLESTLLMWFCISISRGYMPTCGFDSGLPHSAMAAVATVCSTQTLRFMPTIGLQRTRSKTTSRSLVSIDSEKHWTNLELKKSPASTWVCMSKPEDQEIVPPVPPPDCCNQVEYNSLHVLLISLD